MTKDAFLSHRRTTHPPRDTSWPAEAPADLVFPCPATAIRPIQTPEGKSIPILSPHPPRGGNPMSAVRMLMEVAH